MLKRTTFLFLIIVSWLTPLSLLAGASSAQQNPPQSDDQASVITFSQQKATQVFNFTHYVDWPDLSERDLRHQIVICLQQGSQSVDIITDLAQQHTVSEKRLTVQVRELDKETRCDLIYIEQAEVLESEIQQTLLDKISKEVLIVASNAHLYPQISAISFYKQEKRLRFEVNMNIINSLKLNVSSELLKLARIRQGGATQDRISN